jgi:nucleoside-diphosphate-sugar epimerase
LVYVKDTAQGFIKIAESNDLIGHEVNIATQSEISVGNLTQNLINLINPRATILTDEQRIRPEKSEVFRLFGSNEKLKIYTSWEQKYSLDDGLQETIAWFRRPENLIKYKADIYNV